MEITKRHVEAEKQEKKRIRQRRLKI